MKKLSPDEEKILTAYRIAKRMGFYDYEMFFEPEDWPLKSCYFVFCEGNKDEQKKLI